MSSKRLNPDCSPEGTLNVGQQGHQKSTNNFFTSFICVFKPSYKYVLMITSPKSEVMIYEIISLTENLPTRHCLLATVSDWKILYFEVVQFYFQ